MNLLSTPEQLHWLTSPEISRPQRCTCLAMRMVPLIWLLPSSCSIEARGRLFIKPGQDIYEGQVIGIHQRAGDLAVNACKRKAATNIRRCSRGLHAWTQLLCQRNSAHSFS